MRTKRHTPITSQNVFTVRFTDKAAGNRTGQFSWLVSKCSEHSDLKASFNRFAKLPPATADLESFAIVVELGSDEKAQAL